VYDYLAVHDCKPDDRAVNKVVDAMKACAHVSRDLQAPAWLPSASPEETRHMPTDVLACLNWLLDLRTGDRLLPTPHLLTMNALDYAYDRDARAPRWEQFVGEVLPAADARRELQKAFGYMISCDTSQQKIFGGFGKPRSGKGTIGRVLQGLVGKANVVGPKLSQLKNQFGLAQLIDKRLAIVGDARIAGQTAEICDMLLSLTGEDQVCIPRKYLGDWHGTPRVKFFLMSNELPGFTDASAAIASRFIVFRFQQSFLGNEDPLLSDKLLRELPGILNWAIEGLRMLREDGKFIQPASSAELIELMQDLASPTRRFIKDYCIVEPDLEVELNKLRNAHADWAEDAGHNKLSETKLRQVLNAADPSIEIRRPRDKNNKPVWMCYGIALADRRKAKRPELGVIEGGRGNVDEEEDEPSIA
jgi:putative DNA primase/helicase